MTCTVCGLPLPEDAQFCPHCGSPISGTLDTDERKVITVLFADLVDSTGLAQRLDAERAREVLGRFFDMVSEELRALRGQPEKFIGDAVMAVFGLPTVHEDDALRAVRAGLAIRSRVKHLCRELNLEEMLQVRVGIETGEAATGVGPSGQLLVTGTVVNAAARLQAAAAPNEVLIGRTAHALARDSATFADRRSVPAKGFAEPLAAYPVLDLSERSVRRTIPFVGRGNELSILRNGFARVVATDRPLLVTAIGESGIGKSRLADEFLAGFGPETRVLRGRGYVAADSATFAPAAIMVRDAAGIDPDDAPEKIVRRLREFFDANPRSAADEVAHTVDRLALLLGLTHERREESAFVQDTQSAFLALVEVLGAEGPTVLHFEDIHDLRTPMVDLIERLGAPTSRSQGPVMILTTARPEFQDLRPEWGARSVNHLRLRLEPLGKDEATLLARQASGGTLDEPAAAALAARAGGNPFFIVESTGALLDTEPAARAGAALPPTVQAVVAARIDALAPGHRDLARRLSVFLVAFDLEEARLVSSCGVEELRDLEDAEIVVRMETAHGTTPQWRMRHETLREVAYASLPKRLRLDLHARIAEVLEGQGHPTYAAEHIELAARASLDLDPADRTLPERAADSLAAAGDRSRRRMESRSAIDYYERALEMAGPREAWGIREAHILAGQGEARYWLGQYAEASAALNDAVELGTRLNDHWTLALALRFLGDIAINVEADVDKAEALLARSLASAEALDEPWSVARTLLFTGWVPWTRDRFEEAESVWLRARDLASEHGDRWAHVRALTSLSINRAQMDDDSGAKRFIEEAAGVAEEMDDQFSLAVIATQRGRLLEDNGEFEASIRELDEAIEIFGDLGARWELADALAERGIAYREWEHLDLAERDLRRAVHMSEELGERQLAAWVWQALARVAERRGDRTEAAARFRRAAQEDARRPR